MKKLLLAFCILILSVASVRALITNTIDGIDILIFGDADAADFIVVNTNFIAMGNGISNSCDDISAIMSTQATVVATYKPVDMRAVTNTVDMDGNPITNAILDGADVTVGLVPDANITKTGDWTGTLDTFEGADFLQHDGSVALTGDLNAGGQDITNGANVDITGTYKTNGVALVLGGTAPETNTTTKEFTQTLTTVGLEPTSIDAGTYVYGATFLEAGSYVYGATYIAAGLGDIYATEGDILATNGSMIAKTGTFDIVECTGSVDTNMWFSHLMVGATNYFAYGMKGSGITNLLPSK